MCSLKSRAFGLVCGSLQISLNRCVGIKTEERQVTCVAICQDEGVVQAETVNYDQRGRVARMIGLIAPFWCVVG